MMLPLDHAQLVACAPLALVALTVVVDLVVISFYPDGRAAALVALVGLGFAGASLAPAALYEPRLVTALLLFDRYTLFYIALSLVAGAVAVALCYHERSGELQVLLLLATLGAAVLAASVHFVALFLGLEVLSVSLYGLIAFRADDAGLEAGLKYLVLAGLSATFLLFGLALLYAALGTLRFAALPALTSGPQRAVWLTGVAFVLTGLGFKLALVPFSTWAPDIYEGAPPAVTAFVASASKMAVFAVLLRFLAAVRLLEHPSLMLAIAIVAGASMFVGNLLALLQTNLKRLFAYSSIAHLGYLLIALFARQVLAQEAAGYYLCAYVVTMLAAFGLISVLERGELPAATVDDLRGLFWRRPVLAALFTTVLFSLAAIPLTGGFIGKVYVVLAGATASRWPLLMVLVVNSGIGLFYYLRVVVALYSPAPGDRPLLGPVPLPSGVALAGLCAAILWLGVYPGPVIRLLREGGRPRTTAAAHQSWRRAFTERRRAGPNLSLGQSLSAGVEATRAGPGSSALRPPSAGVEARGRKRTAHGESLRPRGVLGLSALE